MDQLDMQCEMARRAVNRAFDRAKAVVAAWNMPVRIAVEGDTDRVFGDELPRKAIR